jgi:hypothetical protein
MKTGNRVKLISYNGTTVSPTNGDPSQNYWRLIGCEGVVEKDPFTCAKYPDNILKSERRVLVRFDSHLSSFGLLCSDASENSLWVVVTDLEKI